MHVQLQAIKMNVINQLMPLIQNQRAQLQFRIERVDENWKTSERVLLQQIEQLRQRIQTIQPMIQNQKEELMLSINRGKENKKGGERILNKEMGHITEKIQPEEPYKDIVILRKRNQQQEAIVGQLIEKVEKMEKQKHNYPCKTEMKIRPQQPIPMPSSLPSRQFQQFQPLKLQEQRIQKIGEELSLFNNISIAGIPCFDVKYKKVLSKEQKPLNQTFKPARQQNDQIRQINRVYGLIEQREDFNNNSENRQNQQSEVEFKEVKEKNNINNNQGQKDRQKSPKQIGLREIAQKSSLIAQSQQITNPLLVAKTICEQMKKESSKQIIGGRSKRGQRRDKQSKEVYNIKRRVYDAFNVLVALGHFTKENNQIHYNGKRQSNKGKKIELAHKIEKANSRIAKLQEQIGKAKSIKAYQDVLIWRNKNIALQNFNEAIAMPFGIVAVQKLSKDSITRQTNGVRIQVEGDYEIFNDIQSLGMIDSIVQTARQIDQPIKKEEVP